MGGNFWEGKDLRGPKELVSGLLIASIPQKICERRGRGRGSSVPGGPDKRRWPRKVSRSSLRGGSIEERSPKGKRMLE